MAGKRGGNMKILVAYATAHGSTGEVAEFIARTLRTYNVEVEVKNVQDVQSLTEYDAYILGSAIHGGMWLREMSVFTRRNKEQLARNPAYFWVTCIRALEEDGQEYAAKYYFDPEILQAIQVRSTAVFTGKLRTDAISRDEAWYLASHYDGRQTPGIINDDFRDWNAIAGWANSVAADLHLQPVFEPVRSQTRDQITSAHW
jgi:menaquinone-dependent protoporphyrinogen oxidase